MREKPKNQIGINAWLQIINVTLQELPKKVLQNSISYIFLWQVYKVLKMRVSDKRYQQISPSSFALNVFAVYDQFQKKKNMEMQGSK